MILVGATLVVLLPQFAGVRKKLWHRWSPPALTLLTLATLGYTVLGVGNVAMRSDAPEFYVPQAQAVRGGAIVYRDFVSSYGPLFPSVSARLLMLWDDPRVFVVMAILMQVLAGVLWSQSTVGRALTGEQRERTAFLFAWGAIPAFNVAVNGHNQSWLAAGLAGTALLLIHAPARSGAVLGFTALVTKFLAYLFIPVFLVITKNRVLWILGLLTSIPVYLYWMHLGADVLQPLEHEHGLVSGGNLWFLLHLVSGGALVEAASYRVLVAAVGVPTIVFAGAWRWRQQRQNAIVPLLILTMAAIGILSPKSFTNYWVLVWWPMSAWAATGSWARVLAVQLISFLGSLEPSLHGRWYQVDPASLFNGPNLRMALLVSTEAGLIAAYLAITLRILRGPDPYDSGPTSTNRVV